VLLFVTLVIHETHLPACLPGLQSEAVAVPERHLGLHMPHDADVPANLVEPLADLVSIHVDLDALLALAATAQVPAPPATALPAAAEAAEEAPPPAGELSAEGSSSGAAAAADAEPADAEPAAASAAAETPRPAAPAAAAAVRVAVARDAAFCFYYNDNLALLEQSGAELVYFSPLVDPLPADISGVYIGGGYPERCVRMRLCQRASWDALWLAMQGWLPKQNKLTEMLCAVLGCLPANFAPPSRTPTALPAVPCLQVCR
jgi:cobyrinic acid a,c-diamide synthase